MEADKHPARSFCCFCKSKPNLDEANNEPAQWLYEQDETKMKPAPEELDYWGCCKPGRYETEKTFKGEPIDSAAIYRLPTTSFAPEKRGYYT